MDHEPDRNDRDRTGPVNFIELWESPRVHIKIYKNKKTLKNFKKSIDILKNCDIIKTERNERKKKMMEIICWVSFIVAIMLVSVMIYCVVYDNLFKYSKLYFFIIEKYNEIKNK